MPTPVIPSQSGPRGEAVDELVRVRAQQVYSQVQPWLLTTRASGCSFALSSPMAFVTDEDARRIEDVCSELRDPVARRWLAELLRDRKERIAVEMQLSRHLEHLHRRLDQAARYLQKLIRAAQDVARSPWPEKLPCPSCGAPAEMVVAEPQTNGRSSHRLVRVHVDGKRCAAEPDTVSPGTAPAPPAKAGPPLPPPRPGGPPSPRARENLRRERR